MNHHLTIYWPLFNRELATLELSIHHAQTASCLQSAATASAAWRTTPVIGLHRFGCLQIPLACELQRNGDKWQISGIYEHVLTWIYSIDNRPSYMCIIYYATNVYIYIYKYTVFMFIYVCTWWYRHSSSKTWPPRNPGTASIGQVFPIPPGIAGMGRQTDSVSMIWYRCWLGSFNHAKRQPVNSEYWNRHFGWVWVHKESTY